MRTIDRHIILSLLAASMMSCTIEPPLNLADREPNAEMVIGEVVTDINVVWDVEGDWRDGWWYGWDETDVRLWGEIAYPEPSTYEGRFYVYGEAPVSSWNLYERQTIHEKTFRRGFEYGYHDMVLWSNIDSHDGTQALIVDEGDPDNIFATTSTTRLGYPLPQPRSTVAYNIPEIFYGGYLDRFYISRDPKDYDYFDEARNMWVKRLKANLYPRVYIYLVQVVVYNNRGRITRLNENSVIDALADGVDVHYGRTSNNPVLVACEMRMKKDLPAREGKPADIFGGKFHTFGLCDMGPWQDARSRVYQGSRADLTNHLYVNLGFSNTMDSTYAFNVTPQLQQHAHGGVITVEIDADTLTVPKRPPSDGASGFDPVIKEPSDTIDHDFDL